ncbi:MAG TPA: GNAT family N-acetyltransferase [Anaerolineales bacterium]|nr:GNAT family N-acetyltransferase [Anaerolineales bacterium]
MTIRIRLYQPSDREFILSLVGRFSGFELPEWRRAEDVDRTNYAALAEALEEPDPGSTIFLAEEKGAPAGFIHLKTQIDYFSGEAHGYISDVAVAPDFEGRGAGRLLLETAEGWARSKGYSLLTLYVFAGNTHARQVYEKFGFQEEVIKYGKTLR